MSDTTTGIADLIERLKKDGVEAGEAEKNRILKAARKEADALVAEAKQRAERIVEEARREAEKQREQIRAELTMAARDFVFSFQRRLKTQVIIPLVEESLRSVLSDLDFLKACLKDICVRFAEEGGKSVEVIVSPETRDTLAAFFTGELEKAIAGGKVTVSDEAGLVGFRLVRDGQSYAWDFSLEAVTRELADLVDPKLRSYFLLSENGERRLEKDAAPSAVQA